MNPPVAGWCDARFVGVRDAFADNFATRGEVGAAVTVLIDGLPVVELHGGWRDESRTLPWQPDTLVNFYSVGKAIVALLLLRQIDRGAFGLDDRIAQHWPEFANGGKTSATIRHALCHRAGVPAIAERMTDAALSHWDRMTAALAATPAWFEPGSRHVYHTNTYGHLVGELVRRGAGASVGAVWRDLVAPLDADLWCGLPSTVHARCADVVWAGPPRTADQNPLDLDLDDDARLVLSGYMNPPGYSSMGIVNTAAWRSAHVPSTNGHGTATGIARLYGALLEPGRLLSPLLLAEATKTQSEGYCPVLDDDVEFGLGFKPSTPRRPFGPTRASFGHFGTGGAVGFADPDSGIAFGYVMNHVIPRWQSTRNRSLIAAVYEAL